MVFLILIMEMRHFLHSFRLWHSTKKECLIILITLPLARQSSEVTAASSQLLLLPSLWNGGCYFIPFSSFRKLHNDKSLNQGIILRPSIVQNGFLFRDYSFRAQTTTHAHTYTHTEVLLLESVNILRKYSGWLDVGWTMMNKTWVNALRWNMGCPWIA